MEQPFIENESEDEGIEDYKMGGYHVPHIGFLLNSAKYCSNDTF